VSSTTTEGVLKRCARTKLQTESAGIAKGLRVLGPSSIRSVFSVQRNVPDATRLDSASHARKATKLTGK
jgi:hypothetical protein